MLVSESIGVNIGVGVDAEVAVGVGLGVRAGKMFRVGDGAAVDVGSSVAAAATVEILVGDSSVSDVGNGTGWVQAHVVRASAIRRPTTRDRSISIPHTCRGQPTHGGMLRRCCPLADEH
mgnify:CR=1 FL=1